MPLTLTTPEVESTSYDKLIIIGINNLVPIEEVTIDYIVLQQGDENPLNEMQDGPDGPEKVEFNESAYTVKRKVIKGYNNIKAIYDGIDTEIQGGKNFEEASKSVLYGLLGVGSVD